MRRIRWAMLGLIVAIAGTVTAGATPSGAASDKPAATEVGVTPTEIHIAVVADVDNSIAPNLFAGSRDAVEGYAKYINKTGGIAGRKLVVDFYDSKLNPNETRNARDPGVPERRRDGRARRRCSSSASTTCATARTRPAL